MNSTYLVLFLCFAASVFALEIQHGLSQASGYPTHDLFKDIKSPCGSTKKAVQNNIPKSSNGCGSASWQVKLGQVMSPYLKHLTSCCDEHDSCFDTCGAPDFEDSFQKCNVDFKQCMYAVCLKTQKSSFSKTMCKLNAGTFYGLVKHGGQGPYNSAQKKHCDCV